MLLPFEKELQPLQSHFFIGSSLSPNPFLQASINTLASELDKTMKGCERFPVVQLFDGSLDVKLL